MDFYKNQFVNIKKLGADFSDIYNVFKQNCNQGLRVKTISSEEVAEFERMIKIGKVDSKTVEKIDDARWDGNGKHPFMQFCPKHVGNPFILGNQVSDLEKALQFALILKNAEKGIAQNEMECINDYSHFENWHDSIKHYDGTMYSTETLQSFLEQALPHFKKFYIANSPLLDETPRQADEFIKRNNKVFKNLQLPSRRTEISRNELEELIGLR